MPKFHPPRGLIAVLSILNANGILAATMYLPSVPAISGVLSVSQEAMAYTLTVYMATFAGGQLLFGPLSDRWGRRPFLLAGMAIMMLGSIACALADSLDDLLFARMAQGFGAASGMVTSRAVLNDVYEREEATRALARVSAALALAPIMAPIVGGLVQQYVGWRGNFLLSAAVTLAVLVILFLRLPETHVPAPSVRSFFATTSANYRQLLTSRVFLVFTLINVAVFAGLHGFNAGAPAVMIVRLGLEPAVYGALIATSSAGFFLGSLLSSWFGGRMGPVWMLQVGLGLLAAGAAGMACYAALAGPSVGAIVGLRFVWTVGMGIVLPVAVVAAMGVFPEARGASSALSGFIQTAGGALGAAAVGLLPAGEILPLSLVFAATAMLGILAWLGSYRLARAQLEG